MVKTFNFLLFFILALTPVCAQVNPAEQVWDTVTKALMKTSTGTFSTAYSYKSMTKTDTLNGTGTVYFFRKNAGVDGFCPFITEQPSSGQRAAFDGEYFYTLNDHSKKVSRQRMPDGKKLKKRLLNFHFADVAPFFMLVSENGQPFEAFQNKPTLVDTLEENGRQFLRLCQIDTINDAFSDTLTTAKTCFHFTCPELQISRYEETVYLLQTQYTRIDFSQIMPLPENNLEALFSLDSLRLNCYEMKDLDNLQASKAPVPLPETGDFLPDFTLQSTEGDTIQLSQYKDGLVLLDFWYMQCAPCIMAMPYVNYLQKKFGAAGLSVLGVNVADDNPVTINTFKKTRDNTTITLMDTQKELANQLHLQGFPVFILLEANTRKILFFKLGYGPEMEGELEAVIEKALKI